jgi:hypothetical protein
MLLAEFEPAFSAGERPQTLALDRAVTGFGYLVLVLSLSYYYYDRR